MPVLSVSLMYCLKVTQREALIFAILIYILQVCFIMIASISKFKSNLYMNKYYNTHSVSFTDGRET